MVLFHLYVGAVSHGLHQPPLYFGSRVICMVQDAELRVTALAMQVEVAILLTVELHAPVHQLPYLLRCHAHHLLNGLAV